METCPRQWSELLVGKGHDALRPQDHCELSLLGPYKLCWELALMVERVLRKPDSYRLDRLERARRQLRSKRRLL
ncbi:hypothetical protein [Mumia zhuanghuii]|uniref:Uncharacterized protein n=1 Tax=Mumia zhuanghuii TaxID=2585211 RepID=A0A5C4LU15_9ACTN|nr:hypothetical protein [Mumia zhuanghuii]TNC22174.1 hypothetical protein FHE65_35845 [Mumia zhuanghuii]